MYRRLWLYLLLVVLCGSVSADVNLNVGFNRGYDDNLFKDSTDQIAPYSKANASVSYDPFSFLQLKGHQELTYYGRFHDLSNTLWGLNSVWLPTRANTTLSAFIQAGWDMRTYGVSLEGYNSTTIEVKAAAGYQFKENVNYRMGVKVKANRYPSDSTDSDNTQLEFFSGINMTFLGSNSLDIEAGWGNSDYKFVDALIYPEMPEFPSGAPVDADSVLTDGDFNSVYISPRFSRPVGSKTGISLIYQYRHFQLSDNAVVLGSSIPFLSPWNAFYDGSSVQLRVKTHLVPRLIISAGAGYWDKTYLRTVELYELLMYPDIPEITYWETRYGRLDEALRREDWQSKLYVEIQRPIKIDNGFMADFSASVQYEDNRSSIDRYDYTCWTILCGVSFKR
ncbi:MAG: hypothetical protein KOO62_06860 [candidate division Zixibacteria bacterium]|nr:hypothetical protein [candidate division Zixibacteria bacterium]